MILNCAPSRLFATAPNLVPTDDAAWEVLQRTRVAAVLIRSDSALIARIRKDPALERVPVILFGSPHVLSPEALSDSLVLILPQRADSHQLLVTIRDSLERGRVAGLMCGAETAARS